LHYLALLTVDDVIAHNINHIVIYRISTANVRHTQLKQWKSTAYLPRQETGSSDYQASFVHGTVELCNGECRKEVQQFQFRLSNL